MSDVFISYRSDHDSVIAERLTRELKRRGLSAFMDREIAAGAEFSSASREALSSSSAVVVLLSSETGNDRWVRDEVNTALEGRKNVIPVLLGPGAKNNWIWPLVADRQAIFVESERDLRKVVDGVLLSITKEKVSSELDQLSDPSPRPPDRLGRRMPELSFDLAARRRRWFAIAIAILGALIGSLLTLLLLR